jgi:hypothetical protein
MEWDAPDRTGLTAALAGAPAMRRLSAPSLRQAQRALGSMAGGGGGAARSGPSSPPLQPLGAALQRLQLTSVRPDELPCVVAAINAAPALQSVKLRVVIPGDWQHGMLDAGGMVPGAAPAGGLEALYNLVPRRDRRRQQRAGAAGKAPPRLTHEDEGWRWILCLVFETPEMASAILASCCLPCATAAFSMLVPSSTWDMWADATAGGTEALGVQLAQCHSLEVLELSLGRMEPGCVRRLMAPPSLPRLRRLVLESALSIGAVCSAELLLGVCLMHRADSGLPPLDARLGPRFCSGSMMIAINEELAAATTV